MTGWMAYLKPEDRLELPDIMKWMKQVFAQRFNAAAGRTEHIWGDQYRSRILEEEAGEAANGNRGTQTLQGRENTIFL
jgi:hypothetical protein